MTKDTKQFNTYFNFTILAIITVAFLLWHTIAIFNLEQELTEIQSNTTIQKSSERSTEEQELKTNNQKSDENHIANIDMSNWKTYRNEELGFEFKYPQDWFCMVTMLNTDQVFCSSNRMEEDYINGKFDMQNTYVYISIVDKGYKKLVRAITSNSDINNITKRIEGQSSDVIIDINSAFKKNFSDNTLDIYKALIESFRFIK